LTAMTVAHTSPLPALPDWTVTLSCGHAPSVTGAVPRYMQCHRESCAGTPQPKKVLFALALAEPKAEEAQHGPETDA